ncbi:hypothetical protein [Inhella gelatinilytica]|uniref:CVNH domain-containing protein n=1 Tax=Inhella gelatinilytica TaxID=2795030 RepID=A0A931IWP0_9BURK|nr:hypothetical protein [Inhella gelatinilytica]MBH9551423.1 hypothetical protein [Inhella gelatinilytica]
MQSLTSLIHRSLAAWALALPLIPIHAAEPLSCPALASAVQIDACPSDEQLRGGFVGYCSDNRRLYAADHDTCSRFENYRKLKNVALWEAGADGAWQGYLSCDVPRERLQAARVQSVTVSRQGTVTRVACQYGIAGGDENDTLTLAHRTKARCAVVDPPACTADPGACRVRCE